MFKWLGPAMPADNANSARLRALYPLLVYDPAVGTTAICARETARIDVKLPETCGA
jgi:hypothetical protein